MRPGIRCAVLAVAVVSGAHGVALAQTITDYVSNPRGIVVTRVTANAHTCNSRERHQIALALRELVARLNLMWPPCKCIPVRANSIRHTANFTHIELAHTYQFPVRLGQRPTFDSRSADLYADTRPGNDGPVTELWLEADYPKLGGAHLYDAHLFDGDVLHLGKLPCRSNIHAANRSGFPAV